MEHVSIEADKSGLYSPLALDYINYKASLSEFISNWPNQEGYRQQMAVRQQKEVNRALLIQVLKNQYQGLSQSEALSQNLSLLENKNCFTITTGQQIHVFLGPMYVYWKVLSCIALARNLKQTFPEMDFVPVFWMATEDHDFEEVNHVELFGRKFIWDGTEGVGGPVGRLRTDGLQEMNAELAALFANQPEWKRFEELFQKAYSGQFSFAQATRFALNELFGDEGLVIIDPDDAALKQEFIPIVKQELLHQVSGKAATAQSEKLKEHYPLQVHPREINLFYNQAGKRKRVIVQNEQVECVDGELIGTLNEIDSWLPSKIQEFSGNVVLRPVYQECILPNLAYVGGPGEVNYWMQFKSVFESFGIPFPIVECRKSVFVIGAKLKTQLDKSGLPLEDFFLGDEEFKNKVYSASGAIFESLSHEMEELILLKDKIIQKSMKVDPSSGKQLASELNNLIKTLKKQDLKMIELQENQWDGIVKKLEKLKSNIKTDHFTQERNQYVPAYLLSLSNFELLESLAKNYRQLGSVILFFPKNI